MLALLALGSSAMWGTADFFAGRKSRSVAPPAVVGISQGFALLGSASWSSFVWARSTRPAGPSVPCWRGWLGRSGWLRRIQAAGVTMALAGVVVMSL